MPEAAHALRRSRRGFSALVLLLAALFVAACNLTTIPPTPTARPETPIPPTSANAPTLFASITPLPGSGGVVATVPAPSNCLYPTGWVQYIVEAGDSISGLAEASGTSMELIISANCLSDPNTLFTGQVLYLPRSPVSG